MGSVGGGELLLIFLVILLLFGSKRIPEIARGLGRGIREFKEATREFQRELTLEDPLSSTRRSPPGPGAAQRPPAAIAAAPSSPPDREAPPCGDEGAVSPVATTSTSTGSIAST